MKGMQEDTDSLVWAQGWELGHHYFNVDSDGRFAKLTSTILTFVLSLQTKPSAGNMVSNSEHLEVRGQ